jgi:AAA domain
MMEFFLYNGINYSKVKKNFQKVVEQLRRGDFAGAEVKKLSNTVFYRAKIDDENRLLFRFARYQGRSCLLLLEVILHHRYSDSRFLNGAAIDETKLQPLVNQGQLAEADILPLPYINPRSTHFHFLDKVISFDDDQLELLHLPPPLIIIGSAGSGKTALTLEKIKTLSGNILYVTLSSFLVENSANLYYAHQYQNEHQSIDFLSFKEYVETIHIPQGRELGFQAFNTWFGKHRNSVKIRDGYKLYEEFKGVITGMAVDKEYLSREDYLSLGVRQSVFLLEEREQVYGLFEKYLQFLQTDHYYDLSMLAVRWQERCQPKYDFIVVDEVQDLTNAQLFLILKSLKINGQFILCGDANQIVHPNFFSWSNVKTMFYQHEQLGNELRILRTNYRNSPEVTTVANKLLKIKNVRFGSIDRESNYLVNAISAKAGEVIYLPDQAKIKQELNQKTRSSTQFAVIVMSQEDKAEARKVFQTPLLFSVQEAKGLEYENIILFNFITGKSREFIEITQGVRTSDLESDELRYARAKDKNDKSLDVYKFYINSLYVAITRAVSNLYILESSQKHPLMELLGLVNSRQQLGLSEQKSSLAEWQREASRLEKQGKLEQAALIRNNILGTRPTPWTPVTREELARLKVEALIPEHFNKKAKDRLFEFAVIQDDKEIIEKLSRLKYRRADKPDFERTTIMRRVYAPFMRDDLKKVKANIDLYGLDYRDEFNLTPLLAAIKFDAASVIDHLLEQGASLSATDNQGMTPFLMALHHGYMQPRFLQERLPDLYPRLRPDTLKIKVDNQLVKIHARSAEFFLLHHFICVQTDIVLQKKLLDDKGMTMDNITESCAGYPHSVLPDFRKKRTYLNSILAKNEVDSKDGYNKKLFLRINRGVYVINPDLELLTDAEQWINIYDMMMAEKINRQRNEEIKQQEWMRFHEDPYARIQYYQQRIEERRRRYEQEQQLQQRINNGIL